MTGPGLFGGSPGASVHSLHWNTDSERHRNLLKATQLVRQWPGLQLRVLPLRTGSFCRTSLV